MKEIFFIAGIGVYLLILVVDVVLYGFISAFNRANYIEIEKQAEGGDVKAQKLDKLYEDESNLTAGINVMAVVANCLLGVFVVDSILIFSPALLWIRFVAVIGIIMITAVFGVIVPGKAVSYNPDKWVYRFYGPAVFILTVFRPITWLVSEVSDLIILLLGKNPDEETDNVTEDEIITIVNEGQEQGLIEDSEAEMITKIIGFGDKQASDIMTHRMNINAMDGGQTLASIIPLILEGSNSRYPVYVNDINNIVGILHIKDVIKAKEVPENQDRALVDIQGLLYEPEFIPETRNINDLFKLMQTNKIHMAVVVDEYGQTSGIVTMEDILEEIVGNIQDEHDEEEEMIKRSEDNTYIVDGMSLLEDLEDELSIQFHSEYTTINGFMTAMLGKIPSKENEGFRVEYEGYLFQAVEVGNRVFSSICIVRMERENEREE